MRIGVISDTHNYFDPQLPALFAGVEHILHAGDVGMPAIILELEYIAPVTAVLGNTDSSITLKDTEVVVLGGRKFLVHHIVDVHAPSEVLERRLKRERPDVVVFGHSHQQFNRVIDGTLYFNPGYAGKKRFNQPRSVAILEVGESGITANYLRLPAGS